MRAIMRIGVFCLGLVAVLTPAAHAGPQVLSWDPVATATGYGVEQSINAGATWTAVTPSAGPTCGGTPIRCAATVTAPATGLALYRISASNAVGTTVRFTAGLWICESCAPPPQAVNIGVQ